MKKEEKLITKEGYILYDTEENEYYDINGVSRCFDEINELNICEDMNELIEEIENWGRPQNLQIKKIKFTYEILNTFEKKITYEPVIK